MELGSIYVSAFTYLSLGTVTLELTLNIRSWPLERDRNAFIPKPQNPKTPKPQDHKYDSEIENLNIKEGGVIVERDGKEFFLLIGDQTLWFEIKYKMKS